MSTNTRNWHAWIDEMPPRRHHLHVVGEAQVGNPGVEVFLTMKEPQGINQEILLLDLHKFQRPGSWPQLVTWVPVRYEKILGSEKYSNVDILENGTSVANVKVEIVS